MRRGARDLMTEGGFEALHDRYRHGIQGYLRRLTGDSALAEELTQEAFLRASRGLVGFRGEAKPSTWLYRIDRDVVIAEMERAY